MTPRRCYPYVTQGFQGPVFPDGLVSASIYVVMIYRCGPPGDRTRDTLIKSQVLYH
jgi:hypothetical protein